MQRSVLMLGLPLAGACVGPRGGAPAAGSEPPVPQEQAPIEVQDLPAPPVDGGLDRIRLTSGEWILGEILELRDDTLVFDSDVLDELSIDWADVVEVRSGRSMMFLLGERETAVGTIQVDGDEVLLRLDDGTSRAVGRADLIAVVPGEAREADYWSGGFTIAGAARSGNADQFESTTQVSIERETAATRGRISYVSTYSEVDDEAIAFNQRAIGEFDVFLSRRLFVRPASFEYYRDPFQGIDKRVTPGAGLGYEIVETGGIAWDVTAGAGWQFIEYSGVQEDGTSNDDVGIGIARTRFEWDLTDDVDFELDYQLQVALDEDADANHNLRAVLSVDLIGDFDLDVGFQWDRIGNPVPLDDGTTPVADDFRLTVGLGWDF